MKGRCQTPECWRKVNFDAHDWLKRGYGDASVHELARTYRCGRVGCRLQFDEFFANGVPLQSLAGETASAVIKCGACERVTTLTIERLIQRLACTKAGDGNTGCNVFTRKITAPCKACGAVRWTGDIRRQSYAAQSSARSGVPGS